MTVSHVIPGKAWHIPVSPSIPYDLAYGVKKRFYAGLGVLFIFYCEWHLSKILATDAKRS